MRSTTTQKLMLALIIVSISPLTHAQTAQSKEYEKIDVSPFNSDTHHWYDIADKTNIINPKPNQPRYKPTEITNIADNILIYQRDNGGWPKNYDMLAILTDQQKDSLVKTKNLQHTTFDNTTTYSHITYLAKVFAATNIEKYKEACLQGIDFTLSAQYANGGWPQYYPLEKNNYSSHITFNDGAFMGIMNILKDISDNKPYYSFVDEAHHKRIKVAMQKGLDCILKCQIKSKGRLTVWCQQHNEFDLSPAWARAFEPPSICNSESTDIVFYLMSIDHPDTKVINAVQSAVKWFDESKITGIKVETIDAPELKSIWMTTTKDKIVVKDSTAPPIWTRYYELGTNRPLFCDRNSKYLYSLAEVSRERRAGYGWYTYNPQDVLNKYTAWQKQWAPDNNVLTHQ